MPNQHCGNCRSLVVQDQGGIDFNQTTGEPKARLSLGQEFKCYRIWVKLEAIVSNSQTPQCSSHKLKTDVCGNFCLPLPLETTAIKVTVKTNLLQQCNACDNGSGNGCHKHGCLRVCQEFAPYTMYDLVWRSYDGSANNLFQPNMGQANEALLRKAPSDYGDGISTLATRGPNNPSARVVSNAICKQTTSVPNSLNLTDVVWIWGQFLDHEIDLTPGPSENAESADIITLPITQDPNEEYPGRTIPFIRSEAMAGSGSGVSNPREQPNHISCFVDGTNVYGYSTARAYALRRLDGSGKLKTEVANNGEVLLPYNEAGLENAAPPGSNAEDFFLAGDIRANENVHLTGMHTLFAREHNRLCDEIVAARPAWTGKDELIYQQARRIVSGLMQVITYNEFLPALLGPNNLPAYSGYVDNVDPGIANEFSTAGYRLGHSMLSANMRVGDGSGPALPLRDSYFSPAYLQQNGIEQVLWGACHQVMQEIDGQVVDDIRNFLFGSPTSTMMHDLAALNIQRGRDHGLPGYNAMRVAYGLSTVTSFSQITSDTALQTKLSDLYVHPDNIDPWVGALVEDNLPNTATGPLLVAMLKDQFERLRNCDRFWYQNDPALDASRKTEISQTKLSDIIRRNTNLTSTHVPDDVFHSL